MKPISRITNVGDGATYLHIPSESRCETLQTHGAPVGILASTDKDFKPYLEDTYNLERGAMLVTCTDGVTDRHGFDNAYVWSLIAAVSDPKTLSNAIMGYADSLPPEIGEDDATIVAVRI